MRILTRRHDEPAADASEAERQAHAERVGQARVEIARRNSRWTELDPVDLVERRGGRLLVSAETDHVYSAHRGVVFQPGTANPIADMAELYYTVDKDGRLTFYHRQPGWLWSEHVRRQAERDARRARPA